MCENETMTIFKKLNECQSIYLNSVVFYCKNKNRDGMFWKIFLNGDLLQTISKFYLIDRKQVGFFKFILEAYDGIAVVETIDSTAAKIKLHIAPGCEPDVENVLNELRKEMLIDPL
jgi:uncharacterized protein DUF4911